MLPNSARRLKMQEWKNEQSSHDAFEASEHRVAWPSFQINNQYCNGKGKRFQSFKSTC